MSGGSLRYQFVLGNTVEHWTTWEAKGSHRKAWEESMGIAMGSDGEPRQVTGSHEAARVDTSYDCSMSIGKVVKETMGNPGASHEKLQEAMGSYVPPWASTGSRAEN